MRFFFPSTSSIVLYFYLLFKKILYLLFGIIWLVDALKAVQILKKNVFTYFIIGLSRK